MASHRRDRDELERMLRRSRPEAPEALVESISALVRTPARRRPMLLAPSRLLALVLTLAMLVMLASFGGVSYATSALAGATQAVTRVATPGPAVTPPLTPAQAQYGKPKPKKPKRPKRRSGVKSAVKVITATPPSSGSGGVLAASAGSDLPFTGFDLTLVLGGGLLLVLVGFGLRRLGSDRQ